MCAVIQFVNLNPNLYVRRLEPRNVSFRLGRDTVALLLVRYLTVSEQTVSDGAISDFGLPSTDSPMCYKDPLPKVMRPGPALAAPITIIKNHTESSTPEADSSAFSTRQSYI